MFPFCPFRTYLLVFHFENLGDGPETKKGQENPKKNQLKKTRENDVPFRNSFNSLMVGSWNQASLEYTEPLTAHVTTNFIAS